ncbi:MAG: hypothetical protein QHH75_02545, partial [Bacillota bacterium]|nr:hypothetical protein [Bacillota bacterium]
PPGGSVSEQSGLGLAHAEFLDKTNGEQALKSLLAGRCYLVLKALTVFLGSSHQFTSLTLSGPWPQFKPAAGSHTWEYWRILDLVDYFLHPFQFLHVPEDILDLSVTVFVIASE